MIKDLVFTKAQVSLLIVDDGQGHTLRVRLEDGTSFRWVLSDLLRGSVMVSMKEGGVRHVDVSGKTLVDTREYQAALTVYGTVREASGGIDGGSPRPAR